MDARTQEDMYIYKYLSYAEDKQRSEALKIFDN